MRVFLEGKDVKWLHNSIKWKIGDGDGNMFWENKWVGECKLMQLFPRLYSISLYQGRTLGEVGIRTVTGWQWCLGWRKNKF